MKFYFYIHDKQIRERTTPWDLIVGKVVNSAEFILGLGFPSASSSIISEPITWDLYPNLQSDTKCSIEFYEFMIYHQWSLLNSFTNT